MGATTDIEWTRDPDGTPGSTWGPVTGCDEVSPGCDHCYAKRQAERFRGVPGHYFENGFDVQLRPRMLDLPLSRKWSRPRRIFVNSMADLFHRKVPDTYIAQVYAVMAIAWQHTFLVFTKRHARMHSIMTARDLSGVGAGLSLEAMVRNIVDNRRGGEGRLDWPRGDDIVWPLPNAQLLVSVEDQERAELRLPYLMNTPAAVRGVSLEPMLAPVDLEPWLDPEAGECICPRYVVDYSDPQRYHPENLEAERDRRCRANHGQALDWVICGGESGGHARPLQADWARSVRDQCVAAQVPFFFKQWGDYVPHGQMTAQARAEWEFKHGAEALPESQLVRLGKKRAGCELDGQVWAQYPDGTGGIAQVSAATMTGGA